MFIAYVDERIPNFACLLIAFSLLAVNAAGEYHSTSQLTHSVDCKIWLVNLTVADFHMLNYVWSFS